MLYVLTLMTDRPRSSATQELLDLAESVTASAGVHPQEIDWLAPEQAVDIFFAAEEPGPVAAAAESAVASQAIDVAVQPAAGRKKRLLLADLESTIICNEMLDELADFANCRAQVEKLTAEAMNGELDFQTSLRRRVSLLRGLPVAALEQAAARMELMPGAATLIATMRQHGAVTALATSGFTCFAEQIRRRLGFTYQHSNVLILADDKLTGEVREPILDREVKRRILAELCERHDIPREEAMAVGDGANDLPMLLSAGLGVAFHAKSKVAAAVRYRVRHGDLSNLLYLQGYRADELVS